MSGNIITPEYLDELPKTIQLGFQTILLAQLTSVKATDGLTAGLVFATASAESGMVAGKLQHLSPEQLTIIKACVARLNEVFGE